MQDPSLKLAIGEFRDHKRVYLAIIAIIALSMTVFTTQSAMNEYNEYATYKSVEAFYGEGIITTGGTSVRNILSGAQPMEDARQITEKINEIPGFGATMRAEAEGAFRGTILVVWGVDREIDDSICSISDKIIEGGYFNKTGNYTQVGMGNFLGAAVLHSPTISGGPIKSSYTRNEYTIKHYPIIVGKSCAAIYDLKVGSSFGAGMLSEAAAIYCDTPYDVVGIFEIEKPIVETLFAVAPIESIQEIKGWGYDTANYICLDIPEGMQDSEIRKTLAPIIGDKIFYSRSDIKNAIEGNLNAIGQTILNITIFASLLLAAAAVKFVMDSIIIRKSREIGTLKALGARDSAVVRIFIYQAAFIGVIAGLIGLAMAGAVMYILSVYGMSLPYSLGAQMKIQFMLAPETAATALAIPVMVALAASILPCAKVARLSPVEAIRRGEVHGGAEKIKKSGGRSSFIRFIRRGLGAFSLALDEMRDHKTIYIVVVLVIGIALSVFALQASYQNNLKESITHMLKDTICADGMILGNEATPRAMLGGGPKIANATLLAGKICEETGYPTVVRSNHQSIIVLGTNEDPIYDGGSVWGIDTRKDETVFNLKSKMIKGSYFDQNKTYVQDEFGNFSQNMPGVRVSGISTTSINEFLQTPYPVIIGDSTAKAHGLDVGSRFSILMPGCDKGTGLISAPFEVIGIYETELSIVDSLMYFAPIESINQMVGYGENDANAIIVKAPSNVDYRELCSILGASVGSPGYETFSWHEAVIYMIGPAFDALVLITYAAITITLVLAAIIINYAMESAISRKTREIGTLKAFGAKDEMIVRIFIYQGAMIGMLSGAVAILISIGMAYLAVDVIQMTTKMPMGLIMKVGFTVTWFIIAITLVTPLITAIVAASIPSKKAAELSPVEAIRKGELNL